MAEESNKEYSVNWKNHMIYVRKAFDHLLASSELVDVTLFCEGKKLRAHKVLLSACSGYFREIFKEVPSCPHPVFILNGVEFEVLSDILRFVYNGEVSVDTARLDSFLKTAQMLQISGLTDTNSEKSESEKSEITSRVAPSQSSETPPTETPITAAPVPTEQPPVKKSVKRQATKEPEEQQPEKVFRNEDNDMYLTDVKCEPNELINFEDPLEDPLQSDLMQQGDDKDFVIASGTRQLGEEEFKRDYRTILLEGPRAKTGRCLYVDNFRYLVDKIDRRITNAKIYWRCQKYKTSRCPGRVITDLDSNLIRVSAEHYCRNPLSNETLGCAK